MTEAALTPDQQRVRSYLLGLSERESWVELWPRVLSARLELLALLDRLTPEQADFRPDPEAWSIRQAAAHALDVGLSVLRTIEELADASERSPEPAVHPTGSDGAPADIADLRRRLIEHGIALASIPQRVPEDPPLGPVAPHSFFGDLHCKAWFLFQRVHDQDHINQITDIQRHPDYPEPPQRS